MVLQHNLIASIDKSLVLLSESMVLLGKAMVFALMERWPCLENQSLHIVDELLFFVSLCFCLMVQLLCSVVQ